MLNQLKNTWRKLGAGAADIIAPRVASETDHWDMTVDVAVIGFGGAGAAAAIEDRDGQRICNEMYYGAQINEQIMSKTDGQAWLILDSTLVKEALGQIGPKRAMWFQSATALEYLYLARRKARTLEALAAKLNISADALRETVDTYNQLSRDGQSDPMGKPADYHSVLDRGPWYALDCRVDGAVRNPSITLGGLRVNEDTGEVLAKNGEAIDGLYAAGRSAVGVASHSYVSGMSIADCIFSGRRAGGHAAGRRAR